MCYKPSFTIYISLFIILIGVILKIINEYNNDNFFETLNYSSSNEDWRSEYTALKIKESDIILTITGSGERPLDLLIKDPQKVISIDLNKMQNNLLRLKMEAIKYFSYDDYIAFFGVNSYEDNVEMRKNLWKNLQDQLNEDLLKFWKKYENKIISPKSGLIYQGRWEKYFKIQSYVSNIFFGKTIKKFFHFNDIEEQKKFVNEYLIEKSWKKKLFSFTLNTAFSSIFFGDPGFYENVPEDFGVGDYLYDKIVSFLLDNLAKESFMLSLSFRGNLTKYDLPPYLDSKYFNIIKKNLNKIEIVSKNLIEYLDSIPENSIDKFSLSDVPSFLDQPNFNILLKKMIKSGRNESRYCIRLFLTNHYIPDELKPFFKRDTIIENELEKTDKSLGYRFIVGSIIKNDGNDQLECINEQDCKIEKN